MEGPGGEVPKNGKVGRAEGWGSGWGSSWAKWVETSGPSQGGDPSLVNQLKGTKKQRRRLFQW